MPRLTEQWIARGGRCDLCRSARSDSLSRAQHSVSAAIVASKAARSAEIVSRRDARHSVMGVDR